MSVAGTIYGVVLNDLAERETLAGAFAQKPYAAPPKAPVVYIRPLSCVSQGRVVVPGDASVRVSATVGLLFSRDASRVGVGAAMSHVGAVSLALDVSYPQADYYRPAIAQQGADLFLPLGQFGDPVLPATISTRIEGGATLEWSLDRLVRSPAQLIADLSEFMTLRAGDMLLIGLPGDAPLVQAGARIVVEGGNLPVLRVSVEGAAA